MHSVLVWHDHHCREMINTGQQGTTWSRNTGRLSISEWLINKGCLIRKSEPLGRRFISVTAEGRKNEWNNHNTVHEETGRATAGTRTSEHERKNMNVTWAQPSGNTHTNRNMSVQVKTFLGDGIKKVIAVKYFKNILKKDGKGKPKTWGIKVKFKTYTPTHLKIR